MGNNTGAKRRDAKRRILRMGESVRADGKYQFKYQLDGKPHFVYSWKLEKTDPLPPGKLPCRALREMEKEIALDLAKGLDLTAGTMTVCELVDRYVKTKIGVKQNTRQGYVTVQRFLAKEPFGQKQIKSIKTSDAKLFIIKLQQEDHKSFSTIHNIRGVLRPAFQMAVDDDVLIKNPFGFQLAGTLINDSVARKALDKGQMRDFLSFIKNHNIYCKYYEAIYILFHTGMRISEFCGLTRKDIDLDRRIVNIERQLLRTASMKLIVETTKTDAGRRQIPITDDVAAMFRAIMEDNPVPANERPVGGYRGFLFHDTSGLPIVAMHWQHRLKNMVHRYNEIYKVQLPPITPHICRHTYCTNMARTGINPKTLQYLMGHSDISVTLNVYTHVSLQDAEEELRLMESEWKVQ